MTFGINGKWTACGTKDYLVSCCASASTKFSKELRFIPDFNIGTLFLLDPIFPQ
jgi:hypothetical protein